MSTSAEQPLEPSLERSFGYPDRYHNASNQTGGFMTEIDIAKIVAQKYAKNAQTEDRTQFSQVVKEEFRNVYKVWSGFVKFIRSQTAGKSKLVDTTFIGHLYKRDDDPISNSNLELLISQDFYEAGKFKNKQLPSFSKNEDIIKQYKEQGRLIQVNPSTISFVVGLNKNLVQRILTDFWGAFIELSRRTQQEVVLDFKIGCLHLYKNGEILFESRSETEAAFGTPSKRNIEPREDISVIDTASAILSSGGGRVMSIKSSYLENLSVRTPQSQFSKASSGFSTRSSSSSNKLLQSQNWLKYRTRQKYESSQRDQHATQDSNAPAPLEEELSRQKVPFPFLSAFIERRTGQRFTKRVKFDPTQSNQEKFLQQIITQIHQNKDKQDVQRVQKREQDNEFLDNLKQKMLLDQQQILDDKRQKQLDFIQANEALKNNKMVKDHSDSIDKKNYKLTYFPFTHGESVLHQRQHWKEMQQADLAVLAQQDAISPIKRKPLNTLKPDELHTIFHHGVPSDLTPGNKRSSPLQVTQEFMSVAATPNGSFLRPNYPYRVKNNDSMAKTMDGAWKRFEDQLKREEENKKKQSEQFQDAIVRDQQAIESEVMRRLYIQDETRKELDKQMYVKQSVMELENDLKRRPDRTTFGPEEDHLLYDMLDNRKTEAKQSTKQDLQYLMKERADRQDFMDKLEKNLDSTMVDQMVQAFHEEQRERKALDHQRKLDLRNAWIEQALINEKVRTIDNLFN